MRGGRRNKLANNIDKNWCNSESLAQALKVAICYKFGEALYLWVFFLFLSDISMHSSLVRGINRSKKIGLFFFWNLRTMLFTSTLKKKVLNWQLGNQKKSATFLLWLPPRSFLPPLPPTYAHRRSFPKDQTNLVRVFFFCFVSLLR